MVKPIDTLHPVTTLPVVSIERLNMTHVISVVDADQDVRRSVCWLLARTGQIVHAYESPGEFLKAYRPDISGCLVFELGMRHMGGMELRQHVAARGGIQPVILLSGPGRISDAVDALNQGAFDILQKPFAGPQLVDAIERACAVDAGNRERRASRKNLTCRLDRLSPRERQVLNLVLDGEGTRVIAKTLVISEKTVHVHRSNIARKMHVESVSDVVRIVLKCQASN